jgi:hypothetical protein
MKTLILTKKTPNKPTGKTLILTKKKSAPYKRPNTRRMA